MNLVILQPQERLKQQQQNKLEQTTKKFPTARHKKKHERSNMNSIKFIILNCLAFVFQVLALSEAHQVQATAIIPSPPSPGKYESRVKKSNLFGFYERLVRVVRDLICRLIDIKRAETSSQGLGSDFRREFSCFAFHISRREVESWKTQ